MIQPIQAPNVRHLRVQHVQHDDVPRALDPVEDEGEFRQHDGDDEVTGAGLRLSTTMI